MERFRWEGPVLTPGKHTIVFDFTYDGPGIAKGGSGVLKVDGAEVDTKKLPHTIPFTMPFDETFDVGVDTRTGVNNADYHPPFRFTGAINKLTFKIGSEQFTEPATSEARGVRFLAAGTKRTLCGLVRGTRCAAWGSERRRRLGQLEGKERA